MLCFYKSRVISVSSVRFEAQAQQANVLIGLDYDFNVLTKAVVALGYLQYHIMKLVKFYSTLDYSGHSKL